MRAGVVDQGSSRSSKRKNRSAVQSKNAHIKPQPSITSESPSSPTNQPDTQGISEFLMKYLCLVKRNKVFHSFCT